MQWWNDLWLNESFATALSYYACAEGGPFVEEFKEESWLHFSNYKRWGITDDLGPNNHNIEADCKNTQQCDSLIDGITYGKGASCLKQLIFLMGWEAFTKGLKLYFQEFKWTNTTLHDFISKLQEGYDQTIENGDLDLKVWTDQWLRTKGPNKISYEYTHDDGVITSFKIRQGFCKFGDEVFRKQSVYIGLFTSNKEFEQHYVTIQDRELTDLPRFIGLQVPEAILTNSNDHGFGVFIIDDRSIRFFEANLSTIENQLNKAVVISQLLVMLRQIMYPATRLPLVLNQMMDEPNQNLINAVYMSLVQAQTMYLPPENIQKFNKEVADFFLNKALKEKEDKKLQFF